METAAVITATEDVRASAAQHKIAWELGLRPQQVAAVARLLDEAATVPFIARYRKEATGSLDEVQIAAIRDRLQQLAELDKRRDAVLASLEERQLLSNELRAAVVAAETLAALEDLYLPYRPKRRTRAAIAREKGLEPLAELLLAQAPTLNVAQAAAAAAAAQQVADADEALQGARDIIAERISEDATLRQRLRRLYTQTAVVHAKVITGKEDSGAKFRDYFAWSEALRPAPSHRVLALLRGESEGVLRLAVTVDDRAALEIINSMFVRNRSAAAAQVGLAAEDSYKRLLAPSMATETRAAAKATADTAAIAVFAQNLRELLLAPPLGAKCILAIDPGFRTGCKVVALDAQGKLLAENVVYPSLSPAQQHQAGEILHAMCQRYGCTAIAIGNGTAGRETEAFVRRQAWAESLQVVMVNESGASVYSASDVAREEFPDKDLTVRGAVSIGRRLLDPLAELVKLDPKVIGVGQYQHDVDQGELKKCLDDTVVSCVNAVGVDLNSASRHLLAYVAGVGPKLAANIVAHRDEHGPFRQRRQLLKVARLGERAYEQCAAFLRIRGGDNPLDGSGVHPERYGVVARMAGDLGCDVAELIGREDVGQRLDLQRYVEPEMGMPTLVDILGELAKPGRDPRAEFKAFAFAADVNSIKDLCTGMRLPGIVTNVTRFGAFVDIGVHQDGLVHISELANHFVRDPGDVVRVQQQVLVTVLEVDMPRQRIALSMREGSAGKSRK